MVLWNRDREEGSAKMQWVETHVPWLSCLKHQVQVRASSHVAEMGIWRDTSSSSVFGLLAGSPHSEFSPANTAWHVQILPWVLYSFFCLSAQVGKWAAIQIAAVSQKMLTKTNQPEACVARKQSASYYASLPFACIHSSDFLINIPHLRHS